MILTQMKDVLINMGRSVPVATADVRIRKSEKMMIIVTAVMQTLLIRVIKNQ